LGWSNPAVIAGLADGAVLLAVFAAMERRVAEPLFQLRLFTEFVDRGSGSPDRAARRP
jgi:hypothetical protein